MDHVKKVLALLGLLTLAPAALAAYPTLYDKTQEPPGTSIYAAGYGVKANGLSMDVQLKAAVDVCNAVGGHLILPPGTILLDGTGTTHILLDGCWMQGSGGNAGFAAHTQGTTFNLTSTTVIPFYLQKNWKVSDVSFYWPNQTAGLVVYPTLFADNTTTSMTNGVIDNITIVNAYDGITINASNGAGQVKIVNSTMFAVHYLINGQHMGQSWVFSNDRFSPAPWISICQQTANCVASVNPGIAGNAIFHAKAAGGGQALTMTVGGGSIAFGWRYGILLDATGAVANSSFAWDIDDVGTIVDSSSGGLFTNNRMTGSQTTCQAVSYNTTSGTTSGGSAMPCFNLGTSSSLRVNNMYFDGSSGDFIDAAGSNTIVLQDNTINGVGQFADGSDYYFINAAGGSHNLKMFNNQIKGPNPAVDHQAHGIWYSNTTPFSDGSMILKNNWFNFMTDVINLTTTNTQVVTDNVSTNSYATGSGLSIAGLNKIVYHGNYWDVDPAVPPVSVSRGDTPANQWNWGIPVIMPSSGTIGANGALTTLTTALPFASPATFPISCWMYFPANAVTASSLAGIYYTSLATASTGTVYNIKLASGKPYIPSAAAIVAGTFSGTTGASYTQTTTVLPLLTFRIPPNSMGPQGSLVYDIYADRNGSSDAIPVSITYGGTLISQSSVATTQHYGIHRTLRNMGVTGTQVIMSTTSLTALSDLASTNTTDIYTAVDSTAAQNLLVRVTLTTASNFVVLTGGTVQANYGGAN